MKTENSRYGAFAFIIAGIYFMLCEFASALSTGLPLLIVYSENTISALGVPGLISPLHYLMNSGFIALGVLLLVGFHLSLSERIEKYATLEYALTAVTALGLFTIAFIHAGDSIHQVGALMAIVGGGLLLVSIYFNADVSRRYGLTSLVLGLTAIIFLIVMILFMGDPSMERIEAIPERISVYALILWSILTGIYLLKDD